MSETIEQISEAYLLCMDYALRNGAPRPLSTLPGCWERAVDDDWRMAINGHGEPKAPSWVKSEVPPFEVYVEYKGWPAGIIGPGGGAILLIGDSGEDTLIAAMKAAGATTDLSGNRRPDGER